MRHVDGKQPETLVRIITMAMTPAYALAHVFLPNLLRLKGHATVMSALERRRRSRITRSCSRSTASR